ncbi:hypothetical protein GCM10023322_25060 [Rugosimonospora acidiphila]|uniref:Spore-associated protein A n=1 Tax=Rugosimonospora acidiphila TaxID=556531 RepID=A0ABP9RS55_9ACTN
MVRSLKNTMVAAAATVLASIGLVTVSQAPASAAYGCSGTLIDTYTLKTSALEGNLTYGNIQLYYSSANSGTDCAVNVATTAGGAGHAKQMSVDIDKCDEDVPGICASSTFDGDVGQYLSYAGPVQVTGTNGHCVSLEGLISYNDRTAQLKGTGATHCR